VEESFAHKWGIRSVEKFNQHFPGAIKEIIEWFRTIKTYDGKPENRFAREEPLSVDEAIEVILHNHESYKKLVKGEVANTEGLDLSSHLKP
jgi:inorganic pyrophosphatase